MDKVWKYMAMHHLQSLLYVANKKSGILLISFSQICHNLCCECVLAGHTAVYIDTATEFDAQRMYNVVNGTVRARKLPDVADDAVQQTVWLAMSHIQVMHVNSSFALIETLQALAATAQTETNLNNQTDAPMRLIIIDNVASLISILPDWKSDKIYFEQMSQIERCIARLRSHALNVVVVNHANRNHSAALGRAASNFAHTRMRVDALPLFENEMEPPFLACIDRDSTGLADRQCEFRVKHDGLL